jgi:DNA-binding NarL/FixJ family response regulator
MSAERPTPPIRVFVVDDHPLVREGILRVLGANPRYLVVGQAGSAPEALVALRETLPDVALLDLGLGRGSGLDLLGSIRAERLPIRCLVVTMHDGPLYAERALRAGALGFIGKDAPIAELYAALDHVARGDFSVPEGHAERLATTLARHDGNGDPLAQLTDRETDVLRLLGQGLTTREIATTLGISPKTVETHRVALKAKLGIDHVGALVRFAVEHLSARTRE